MTNAVTQLRQARPRLIAGQGSANQSDDFSFLVPAPAYAQQGGGTNLEALVAQGEDLFFNETFDGNGRTCGLAIELKTISPLTRLLSLPCRGMIHYLWLRIMKI